MNSDRKIAREARQRSLQNAGSAPRPPRGSFGASAARFCNAQAFINQGSLVLRHGCLHKIAFLWAKFGSDPTVRKFSPRRFRIRVPFPAARDTKFSIFCSPPCRSPRGTLLKASSRLAACICITQQPPHTFQQHSSCGEKRRAPPKAGLLLLVLLGSAPRPAKSNCCGLKFEAGEL
jgi:hypothetical protein